jgi:Fe-S cluster biogenesis protein NfuA
MVLTSAGSTATVAQWQSALRSITFTDSIVTPDPSLRTISFSATDSLGNTSATATRTVTVTDTDQSPIVHTTGGTTSYVGASSAVTIDTGITVSDQDNATQSSGTVSVSGGFHSGDTLSFTNDGATMGNIVGSYNAATGVLTLTSSGSSATDAQWANALKAVTFSSTSTSYGNRTISFTTNDGTKTSAAGTDTVNMTAPPTITTDSGSAAFVAGDNVTSTPVAIDSGLTITDGSATTLGSATVAITGNFHSGEDSLAFANDGSTMGNIVASYNSGTGVMTLTSSGATATLAQWQSALRSVTYTDTVVTPNPATRTISFTAVDGAGNTSGTSTRTVTVTDTDQTPIVHTTGGTASYVGASAGVTIDGHVTVSDQDNLTQTSATVAVTTGFHTGDVLSFTNNGSTMGNIQASYSAGTGVLLLSSIGSTATDAQWANALSSVTFSSTSTTYGDRTIWYQVNDGTKNSTQAADTVHMTAPPAITTDAGSAAFVSGDNTTSTPIAIDAGLTVTDGSATTFA